MRNLGRPPKNIQLTLECVAIELVQPLRDEVIELEKDAEIAEKKKNNLVAEVSKLESSIAQYKTDYAKLIKYQSQQGK